MKSTPSATDISDDEIANDDGIAPSTALPTPPEVSGLSRPAANSLTKPVETAAAAADLTDGADGHEQDDGGNAFDAINSGDRETMVYHGLVRSGQQVILTALP